MENGLLFRLGYLETAQEAQRARVSKAVNRVASGLGEALRKAREQKGL